LGESQAQREMNAAEEHLSYELKMALAGVPENLVRKCIIAYEPLWAIGTGVTATPEQAEEICAMLREIIRHTYGAKVARAISILYGGSMNPTNVVEMLQQPDIDGGLIGGAGLKAESFVSMINKANIEN